MSSVAPRLAKTRKPRGRRGLDKSQILDSALDLLATEGEAGFSIRKLGASIGVDPMTVLHHFESKEQLLRLIADRSLSSVELPPSSKDWQTDLRKVADAYRALAHRHPRLFHLHFRFHATGPVDHASSEVVYRAMRATGLPNDVAAGLGLSFFAFVLGFALAETEGLLLPVNELEEAELRALPSRDFPATRALIPAFRSLKPDAAFDVSVSVFIDGIAARSRSFSANKKVAARRT